MKIRDEDDEQEMLNYGDSDFLADNDLAIKKFRGSEKDAKRKIIDKMLTLRHNMKYNKHLLSVYVKAKALFDEMVEEHRLQIDSLDEIYRHLNQMIRENLSKQRIQKKKDSVSSEMLKEMTKDKNRIGALLKKMRVSYQKLMNVDTILGVTVDKINEITFIEDDDHDGKSSEDEEDEPDNGDDDNDNDEDENIDEDDDEGEDDEEYEDEGEGENDQDTDDEDVVEEDEDEDDEDTDDEDEEDEGEDDADTDDEGEDDADTDDEDDDEDTDDENEKDNAKRAILVF